MRNLFSKFIVTLALGLLVTLSSATAAEENVDKLTLNIGLYTSSKPSAMVRKFRPIISLLEQKVSNRLGKKVRIRMQIAKSNLKGIEYLSDGKVDFAQLGPATYVEAKSENPEIQILAIESKNRTKEVNGIIATGLYSSIENISDLKGESFAFGDMQSTSGRYMAQQFLMRHGILAKDLSRYEYLGRHDIVAAKVSVGDFAAGAMSEATFRRMLAEGAKIRELARFSMVSKPWVARSGIDPEVYAALKISLLEIAKSDVMASLDFNGFIEGRNEDFWAVAESMSLNHRFFSDVNNKRVEWVLASSKKKSVKK